MNKSQEKTELLIDNKIFTKDDLLSLIQVFINSSNEILGKSKEIKRKELIQDGWKEQDITDKYIDTSHSRLELISSDNSKYTGTFEEISEANEVLDNKKIVEINLYFSENVLDTKFVIKIRFSGPDAGSGSSYASVEGQDSSWVNGTTRHVEDFLSSCRNQSGFVKKFEFVIIGLIVLILMIFLLNLTELFIKTKLSFPRYIDKLFSRHIISYTLVLLLITITPAVYIYRRLRQLFPGIEIRTGKNFQRAQTEKRRKLLIITSLVLIPAIISYLFRLL